MAFLDWSEDFSVGVQEIDDDHQKLIDILNDLEAAYTAGHAADVIGGFLEDLIEYTVWHFRHEESLMQKHHYPDLLTHRAMHAELTETAESLHQQFTDGDHQVGDTLLPFLRDWLMDHIMQTDKKAGAFLVGKMAAEAAE